jgi:hypothetical protein
MRHDKYETGWAGHVLRSWTGRPDVIEYELRGLRRRRGRAKRRDYWSHMALVGAWLLVVVVVWLVATGVAAYN